MHWNYRVMRHDDPIPDWVPNRGGGVETWYGIHEVYYASEDDSQIDSYSVEAQPVVGESPEVLKDVLQKMLGALEKPVLVCAEVFPDKESEPQQKGA